MNTIHWELKNFGELTTDELYDLLALRAAIFVVEQECVYLDTDGKDRKAWHVLGRRDGELVAYARIFAPGDYFDECSIGRVVVATSVRWHGVGHQLMSFAIAAASRLFGPIPITISAQRHLENFYRTHLFKTVSAPYLEDGIPHVRMRRESPEL